MPRLCGAFSFVVLLGSFSTLVAQDEETVVEPFADEKLTTEDIFDWQDEHKRYLVTRGGVSLGYLAGRDGQPVPRGNGPPVVKKEDTVQAWRYHVVIFSDLTTGKHDQTLASKRYDSRRIGCWDAGGYTPDLCCATGGWKDCWSELYTYDNCCAGWASEKDASLLERVRSAFDEASAVLHSEGQPYSLFYIHPLLHSVLLDVDAQSLGRPLVIVEVGVDEGAYAWHMLAELKRRGVSVDRFYAIDPWLGKGVRSLTPETYHEPFAAAVKTLIPFWPQPRVIQECGDVASRLVDDSSVDFVFIDAIHTYDYVTLHLDLYWPKLRPGGIMAGHDFAQEKPGRFPGPVLAAQAFAKRRGLTHLLLGLPGTTFLIMKPAEA